MSVGIGISMSMDVSVSINVSVYVWYVYVCGRMCIYVYLCVMCANDSHTSFRRED